MCYTECLKHILTCHRVYTTLFESFRHYSECIARHFLTPGLRGAQSSAVRSIPMAPKKAGDEEKVKEKVQLGPTLRENEVPHGGSVAEEG